MTREMQPRRERTVIDTTSLFLHVLAAISLVGGGIVQVLAGVRLRASTSPGEVRAWATFTRGAGWLVAGAAVVSLMTGGHLAGAVWGGDAGGFANPFITLGTIGLLVLAPIGPMVGGARLRRLAVAADPAGTSDTPGLLAEARSPGLWGAVHSLVGVGVGEVALMIYKPGWLVGAVVLAVTFGGGWFLGALAAGRATRAAHD